MRTRSKKLVVTKVFYLLGILALYGCAGTMKKMDDWSYKHGYATTKAGLVRIQNERREKYISENPNTDETIKSSIRKGYAIIGMKAAEVVASIGEPNKKNVTVGTFGRHEQWVYMSRYIYFEDGIVTSWQSAP